MSQPGRPVPGPPRPGPAGGAHVPSAVQPGDGRDLVEQLRGRPVADHPALLEAEHDRLHRRLATIDQL